MGFIGLPDLLILAAIIFIVVGRRKLPALGRSMRSAGVGFKRGLTGSTPKDIIEGQGSMVRPASVRTESTREPAREPIRR
jgi:Sec-independent protein translocase protein TatA